MPAPNRFPSAADGKGFKPLADQIHAMGLKFGIHVMRGIPRQSVKANTPIEGSEFKAADAANTGNICPWCPDMFGVDAAKPAGQAWYDSIVRLYAAWGVDFIKVDDLSSPYSTREIEAIRRAIDRCGRAIVFSTSPGETPVSEAAHVETHANMWRISGDFWDNWDALNHNFRSARRLARTRRTRSLAGRRHDSARSHRQAQRRRKSHDAIQQGRASHDDELCGRWRRRRSCSA